MDLPLMSEALRLQKLAERFPDSPVLGAKLGEARTLHEAAAVFLGVWLTSGAWPTTANQFQADALALAQSIVATDTRKVVSIETFSLGGTPTKLRDFDNAVQSRLNTTSYSLHGSASFAEAGGMSDVGRA